MILVSTRSVLFWSRILEVFATIIDHIGRITRLPLTLMVTSNVQAGPGVVNGDDAGISTYSLIVALRPRPKSTVPLPPTPVCERLRTLLDCGPDAAWWGHAHSSYDLFTVMGVGLASVFIGLDPRHHQLIIVYVRHLRLQQPLHGRLSYSEHLTSDHCSTSLMTSLRYVATSTSTFCA